MSTTTRLIEIDRESRRIESDARHARSRILATANETHAVDRLADADLEGLGIAWSKLCKLQTDARKLRRDRCELRAADA